MFFKCGNFIGADDFLGLQNTHHMEMGCLIICRRIDKYKPETLH